MAFERREQERNRPDVPFSLPSSYYFLLSACPLLPLSRPLSWMVLPKINDQVHESEWKSFFRLLVFLFVFVSAPKRTMRRMWCTRWSERERESRRARGNERHMPAYPRMKMVKQSLLCPHPRWNVGSCTCVCVWVLFLSPLNASLLLIIRVKYSMHAKFQWWKLCKPSHWKTGRRRSILT